MNNKAATLLRNLIKIGLSEKEASVYLAAIQVSTFTPALIAKMSGLKRPTVYIIIEALLKKNLIARVPDSRGARFIAVEPYIVLEKEKEKIKAFEDSVSIMDQLRKQDTLETPHIELYYGKEGVKQIYRTILDDKPSEISSIANPDYLAAYIGDDFVHDWVKKRVSAKIFQYALQNGDYDSRKQFPGDKTKMRELRFLPGEFKYNTMYYIWDNKVGFISDKSEGISFIVTSQEFSTMQKANFKIIWESSN